MNSMIVLNCKVFIRELSPEMDRDEDHQALYINGDFVHCSRVIGAEDLVEHTETLGCDVNISLSVDRVNMSDTLAWPDHQRNVTKFIVKSH